MSGAPYFSVTVEIVVRKPTDEEAEAHVRGLLERHTKRGNITGAFVGGVEPASDEDVRELRDSK